MIRLKGCVTVSGTHAARKKCRNQSSIVVAANFLISSSARQRLSTIGAVAIVGHQNNTLWMLANPSLGECVPHAAQQTIWFVTAQCTFVVFVEYPCIEQVVFFSRTIKAC